MVGNGHDDVPRRPAPRRAVAVVALSTFGAGALLGATLGDRGEPARVNSSDVINDDGMLPTPVPLELHGWRVTQQPAPPVPVQCALVQPYRSGTDDFGGAPFEVGHPRLVLPDPAGDSAALVVCRRTTDGTFVTSVAVRPRAYRSTPDDVGRSAVVSELPIERAQLDELAVVADEWDGLTVPGALYLIRTPLGGFDPRATVRRSGAIELPAPMADDLPLARQAAFHAIAVYALRSGGVSDAPSGALLRSYVALLPADAASDEPTVRLRAVWLPAYIRGGLDVETTLEDVAASALTVLRYHPRQFAARLAALPAADRVAVREFVDAAVEALVRDDDARRELVRKMPGIGRYVRG